MGFWYVPDDVVDNPFYVLQLVLADILVAAEVESEASRTRKVSG
jgi:hypothetical protein